MDNNDVQLVGGPCGQHGPYTFYKAFKYTKNGVKRIVTLSEFFFVKMWRDSDLLCIGELQLLWTDKNSEQMLASLRLYFLPENTPEGRTDHGEDEVLAISEKVVIKVEDLVTWMTAEAEWSWGRLAKCERDLATTPEVGGTEPPTTQEEEQTKVEGVQEGEVAPPRKAAGVSFAPGESHLDFGDVENERRIVAESQKDLEDPHVIILSFPRYCRYRAMMKRLEGVEDSFLKLKLVNALGGFYVTHPNTRVLFCKDTFDYPELEGHEMLCNHLAPKLKGRPRGRRKKRSASPGSESNESESSVPNGYNAKGDSRPEIRCDSGGPIRRSTRCHENNENKEFIRKLTAFMKSNRTPIGRTPSLGYKELNLHEFFSKVQKLGGYDNVTANRLWKSIFEDISGYQNNISATVIRRHYERFLLSYERHLKGEQYKPLPVSERRRLKSKRGSSLSDAESSGGDTNSSVATTVSTSTVTENKESKSENKISSLRSIRVKPERQKEKQQAAENDSRPTNLADPKQTNVPENAEIKPRMDTLVINSTNMTSKFIPADSSVKLEFAMKQELTVKSENVKMEDVKMEADIKDEVINMESYLEVKIEVKEEGVKNEEEKCGGMKSEDDSGQNTTAVASEGAASPKSSEEPIPYASLGSTAQNHGFESKENSLEQERSEITITPAAAESFKNKFIQEVKKRKLDILKEGGLEVTPVKPSLLLDSPARPSVIQQTSSPKPMQPPSVTSVPRRTSADFPQTLNISKIRIPPTTPTKKPSVATTNNSFAFMNGTVPPKVVQSKSIYTYSEKTIYGNPKDVLTTFQPAVAHTPKFRDTIPQHSGGDPVDLSVTSPQKPVLEIMRVPQLPYTPYNRDTVTKNLTTPLMDGRRLGPNLEITLVNPKNKASNQTTANSQPKPHSYSAQGHVSSTQSQSQKRRVSDYYSPRKMMKSDDKFVKPLPVDLNVPNPFKNSSQPKAQTSKPSMASPTLPTFPPFLAQLYEQTAKSGISPYLPFMDPAMYYSATMQNLYSAQSLNNASFLPIPTPEQIKLYTELMARSRLNFPMQMPLDGVNSFVNNNLKKQ
nr:unnamed protein product [Callosobruchus chinensis]